MLKTFVLIALSGVIVAGASAQDFLMMPDSTNNRVVTFDPFDGHLVNSNLFALTPSTTPVHAMQVGNEVWVSEQIGDKISRWALDGTSLGAVTGTLDNVRGMALVNGTVYLCNSGTGNGAPGHALFMYDMSGNSLGSFAAGFSSPFGILDHQGGLLVSSDAANDDVHKYGYAGADLGTFHNSTGLNFVEQMDHAANGDVLAAGFSSNIVATLDANSGAILNSFTASGARGVHLLGNGNVMWTNGSGAWVFNTATGGSTQVYTGGGRYIDLYSVPEPVSMAAMALGSLLLLRRRRK